MLFAPCHHSMRIQYISITAARSNRRMYRDMRLGKFFSGIHLDVIDYGPNMLPSTEYRT
jgi:hypothetical protein